MNRRLILGLLGAFVGTLLYKFLTSPNTPTAPVDVAVYQKNIAEERAKKDEFFRTSPDSPITNKAAFAGLAYFAPDPTFRVTARLEPFADKTQKLVVKLSDGSEEVYEKYAHVVFALNGQACRLLVVKQKDTYSVLFRDSTSGKDTYGGGRYIDLDAKQFVDNQTVVDFNAAYNPYCAYNHDYACPLPPAENTLPVPVPVGEKYQPEAKP